MAPDLGHGGEQALPGEPGLAQELGRSPAARLIGQGEQQVLDAHVLVFEVLRFRLRGGQGLIQARRDIHLPGRPPTPAHLRQARQGLGRPRADRGEVATGALKDPGGRAVLLLQERQQQVLTIHLLLVMPRRQCLRLLQRLPALFGHPI